MEPTVIDLRQHRSFMDTLTAVFEYLRSAFKPYFWSITVIAGPYILVAGIALGFFYQDLLLLSSFGILDPDFLLTDFILPIAIAYSALLVANIMLTTSSYAFMKFAQRERRYPNLEEVRAEMSGTLGLVIGSSILIVLIEIVMLILLVLPGIWMAVPLSLVIVIRINEDRTFSSALSRAFDLIREHWWWTFGILFLCYIAQSIAASILSAPLTLLTMFNTVSGLEGGDTGGAMSVVIGVLTTASQITTFYFSTILVVATAAIYYNHVERKDATQLSERVAGLAGTAPGEPHAD